MLLNPANHPRNGQILLPDGQFVDVVSVPIAFVGSGNHTIVNGVANFSVRLVAFLVMVGDDTDVEWRSGATTVIVGAMPVAARGGYEANWLPEGYLAQAASGDNLTINSSVSTTVGGTIDYALIPD